MDDTFLHAVAKSLVGGGRSSSSYFVGVAFGIFFSLRPNWAEEAQL
jgi:hypothetical protein